MAFKNVDAPRRPDTKTRTKKSDAVDIPKSGPNRNPKLTTKKSATSQPDTLRESGVTRWYGAPRTNIKSGGRK
jgi:hypothetical protein